MKRTAFGSLFSLILIACAMVGPASAEFKKTKIAVLDFQLQGGKHDSSDMGKIVAEWLITALVKEGRFDVIERRLLEKVLEEQKMHASGLVDESSASRLGKVLGAKVVITGSVMQFQNIMEVNARIIEVESSSIVAAENVKSTSAAKLEDLVVQMADKIISDFPLEGYVVQREEDSVLIDLGKRAGVKPGMQFIVYKEGKIIKHPKTGEVLDIERIETGMIQISNVKTKTADAKIMKENKPGAISTGQLVKSYNELMQDSRRFDSGRSDSRRSDSRRKERAPRSASVSEETMSLSVSGVDAQIEELRRLKMDNNGAWKAKYKEINHQIDILEKQDKKSPDVFLARAKMMEAIDKLDNAEKFIHKALSVSRHYPEAYELKGDMYMWDSMKQKPSYSKSKALKRALDGYEDAAKYAPNKDFQAEMYLKMGNAYFELGSDREKAKAKEFWQKAISTAPSSQAAKSAGQRLTL